MSFLLNTTINSHIKKFESVDPVFVEMSSYSIFINDITTGFPDVMSTYEFYVKLFEACFN